MVPASIKLFDFLTQPDPNIHAPRAARATKKDQSSPYFNDKWPEPREIREWKDFNIKTIRTMFGGKLGRYLNQKIDPETHYPQKVESALLTVRSEPAVEKVVGSSQQKIVLHALAKTSKDLVHQTIAMISGADAVLPLASDRSAPDWAGTSDVTRSDEEDRSNNILPGDTKTSWGWRSSDIDLAKTPEVLSESKRQEGPLRQLLHYCCFAFARYGYLITDQELFVIRVSDLHQDRWAAPDSEDEEIARLECMEAVSNNPLVEYRSIPWRTSRGASNEMTINLALWVLHILAANNGRLQRAPYGNLLDEKLVTERPKTAIPRANSGFDKHKPASFETQLHSGGAPQALSASDEQCAKRSNEATSSSAEQDSQSRDSDSEDGPSEDITAPSSPQKAGNKQTDEDRAQYSFQVLINRSPTLALSESSLPAPTDEPRYPKRRKRN